MLVRLFFANYFSFVSGYLLFCLLFFAVSLSPRFYVALLFAVAVLLSPRFNVAVAVQLNRAYIKRGNFLLNYGFDKSVVSVFTRVKHVD